MTKDDINKLFFLLKQFYPKINKGDTFKLAWEMALEPYSYEQVKEATLAHVREKKFFPDIAEIVERIPKEQASEAEGEPDELEDPDDQAVIDKKKRSVYLKWLVLRERQEKPVNPVTRYAAENHMTVGEAERAMGMTWEEAAQAQMEGKT